MDSETASGDVDRHDRSWERSLPQLMVRYQGGDPAAVDELIQLLSRSLMQFFSASHKSRSDADDLFQDCWLRIHRSRHTYRPPEPVLPWIFAIARYTRLDGYRIWRRRESREIPADGMPEASAGAPETDAQARQEFDRLMESLPESQREVIVMLKVSGMSLEEVARATASTVGAVKLKAHRAYEKLRRILERERA